MSEVYFVSEVLPTAKFGKLYFTWSERPNFTVITANNFTFAYSENFTEIIKEKWRLPLFYV